MTDFERQLQGFSLATVDINYWRPDHPRLLQNFSWQLYDVGPQFPELKLLLDHWKREIEATIHSIRVAHRDVLGPSQWRISRRGAQPALRPLSAAPMPPR